LCLGPNLTRQDVLSEDVAIFLEDDMEGVTTRLLHDYGGEISGAFADALAEELECGYDLEGRVHIESFVCTKSSITVLAPYALITRVHPLQAWRPCSMAGSTPP
jgi:hypothetical protein